MVHKEKKNLILFNAFKTILLMAMSVLDILLFLKKPSGSISVDHALGWCFITGLSGRKEMIYLTTHSTHFHYSYMGSNIW